MAMRDWSKFTIEHIVQNASAITSVEDATQFLQEWRWAIKEKDPNNPHPIAAITSHLDYYVSEYGLPRPNMWADALILAFPVRAATKEEATLGNTTKRFQFGSDIKEVSDGLAKLAAETGKQQRYEFNECMLVADPGFTGEEVAANFYVQGGASRIRYLGQKRITDRIADAGEALLDALEGMLKPFQSKHDEKLARRAAEDAIKRARGDG